MKTSEAVSLQNLLRVARGNAVAGRNELKNVAWPRDMVGISKSINRTVLALEQTMTVIDKILEDLK